jgi:hypothetical protein
MSRKRPGNQHATTPSLDRDHLTPEQQALHGEVACSSIRVLTDMLAEELAEARHEAQEAAEHAE